jgi:hypothetical protein
MGFAATNYTVSMLLLMAFTVGMMIVRGKKPLDNNWPLFYWILVLLVSIRWPSDFWEFHVVLAGAVAGAMLRYEFMNRHFVWLFRFIELAVQIYMLYFGLFRVVL